MSWLVDNANLCYLLLGMVALASAAAWWVQRQPRYRLVAAVTVGVLIMLWLLTRVVVTDRQQIEASVRAMADAVVNGKKDVLLKHLASDFEFQAHKRDAVAESVSRAAKLHQVYDIHISSFEIEEMQDRTATAYFRATARARAEDTPHMLGCRGFFVKDNNQWKLREVRFFNPIVNENVPITLPL